MDLLTIAKKIADRVEDESLKQKGVATSGRRGGLPDVAAV